MTTQTIELTEHFSEFVMTQIALGKYQNANEVLLAGLHLLELHTQEEQEKLKLLKSLVNVGVNQLNQGAGIKISSQEQLAEFIATVGQKVEKAAQQKSS